MLLNDFKFIQILVQFFKLILFACSLILLYFSIYVNNYRDVANIQNTIPNWIPIILILISAVVMLISIFGYFVIQKESKYLILI